MITPLKQISIRRGAVAFAVSLVLLNSHSPLVAQVVDAAKDEPIKLSPFIVGGEGDEGYRATSTLAGTRIRTNLGDVGSAIQVITEKFLQDTGARNSEELLTLTTGTETASTRGNYSGISVADRDTNETPNLTRVNANTRVRGLGAADNTRDFFLTDIPWDSYNTGRVDLQRGPNSILFGLGNPSGIINAGLNTASFKNGTTIETRFGSYDSYRGSLDINRVLLKDELALRVDGVWDRTNYQQRPAFNKDKRVYGAVRFDPRWLATDSSHFTLRANFEGGHVDQNRPRVLPPIDRITPWFNTTPVVVPDNPIIGRAGRSYVPINRSVYDLYTAYRNYDPNIPGSGAVGSNSSPYVTINGQTVLNPNYQPGISEIYTDGADIFFPDPNAATLGNPNAIISESSRTASFGIGANGAIDRSVGGIPFARFIGLTEPWKLAQFYGRPFYGNYVSYSLTDPSIFDFYHQLLDGPNKPSTRDFTAFNVDLSETILDNRAGASLAFNSEHYRDRTDALLTDRYQMINVDINATLPDGTPNPNVGRPFISGRSTGTAFGYKSDRKSFRATVFGELRATDFIGKSIWSDILGRHVFTGVSSTDDYKRDNRSWARLLLDSGWSTTSQGVNSIGARSLQIYQYIGPDLRSVATPAGLHLQAPTAFINPTSASVRYFDSRWQPPTSPTAAGYVNPAAPWVDPFNGATRTQSENPANYGGWKAYSAQVLNSVTDGPDALTTSGALSRNKLGTEAINWQGYMWDETFIPLFGYRRDTNKVYNTNAVVSAAGIAQVNDPATYHFTTPRATLHTETKTWGGVLHMPPFLRGKLPWGTSISLTYNRSSNFNPSDVGRVDVLNRAIPPSSGKSRDYGFVISTLNDKLNLRVNWYKTAVVNATFNWGAPQGWVYDDEARGWQMASRLKAGLSGDPRFVGTDYNYYTVINGVNTFTDDDRARQQRDVDNYFKNVPTELFAAGGIPNPGEATWVVGQGNLFSLPNGSRPSGYTATRDTVSKGIEFELTYSPTKSWNIMANASKTEASTTNNVAGFVDWLEKRNAFWNGPAGDMLLFHFRTDDAQPKDTMRNDWNNNVGFPYQLQKFTNGANVQELPKWRFNGVSTYTFIKGPLKGVKIGGAYRWTDRSAIGYPWQYLTLNGTKVEAPDVAHPVYAPSDRTVDLWVGYSRELGHNIRWEIQLNVRNVFGSNTIIPVSVQPDGSFASYRIKEGRSWTITNSFKL